MISLALLSALAAPADPRARRYVPPRAAQAAAREALALRRELPPSRRGGTRVGVATARWLASGRAMPYAKVAHVARYFPRHAGDRHRRTRGSRSWQAWGLWGGDAGRAWAEGIVAKAKGARR